MSCSIVKSMEVEFGSEVIALRGDATAWLPRHRTLLVADLHLGKDASFRTAGIPVPTGVNTTILEKLGHAIKTTEAKQLVILGDLIHDRHSMTDELIEEFTRFTNQHAAVRMSLVRGNHDRHIGAFPETWRLEESMSMQLGALTLSHVVQSTSSDSVQHQVGGHWHPVINVGAGADRMRLPCFVLERYSMTLPAFGPFKGGMQQTRSAGKQFYPICDGTVWHAFSRNTGS